MIKRKDKVYEMSFKEAVIFHVSFIYHPFNLDAFAMDKREKWKTLPLVFGRQGILETEGDKFCTLRHCSQPPSPTSSALQLLPGRN